MADRVAGEPDPRDVIDRADGAAGRGPVLSRAPMVAVAAALIAGIVAGRYAQVPLAAWLVLGLVVVALGVAAMLEGHRRGLAAACVLLAVAACGGAGVNSAYYTLSGDHIVTYTGHGRGLASVRGQIVTCPQILDAAPDRLLGYVRPARTTFILDAQAVRTGDDWAPASGLAAVEVSGRCDGLAAGQRVEICAWMGRFGGPANPGQFDHRQSNRRQGVLVRIDVPQPGGVTVMQDDASWLSRAYWHLRAAAREHLGECGRDDEGRLVTALIVGDRHPALSSLNRAMMRAGTVHYLSISGTHLVIFLGFVYAVCRVVLPAPRQAAVTALVVLGAYMLLTEPNAPLLRSALMAAAVCCGVISGRPHAALNSLALAAAVILALDPLQLFSPGFQLSFGIVLGLIVLYPSVRGALFGRWLRRRGLVVFRDDQRVRRWLYRRVSDAVIATVTASVTAYLVSAPLAAWHFGLFSPWAVVLSPLLAVPVALVLIPGYLSMALQWPMPTASRWFGEAAGWGAGLVERCVRLTENLPGLSMSVREVGMWWVALCAAAMVLFVVRRRLGHPRLWLAAAVVALAAATAWTQRTAQPPNGLELNVLAIGPGQCVVLRTPDGATHLIDAGTRAGYDAGEQTLLPFLRHQRLPMPRDLFVSHANSDHFNAATSYLDLHGLDAAYLNEVFAAPPDEPEGPAAGFLNALSARRVPVRRLAAGACTQLDERTRVDVLWPPAQPPPHLNDTSLVLRVTCDGLSVLLPGDIEDGPQAALTARGGLAADVLVLPHHGSWRKSLPAFVAAVAPKVVIVSSWENPTGPTNDQSARDFYQRLKTAYRYYCTERDGWCQVTLGGGRVDVQTAR